MPATSRETASTGSPRSRRRTTSFFRAADQRLTSAAAPGSPPVALRAPSADLGAILQHSSRSAFPAPYFRHSFTPNSCPDKSEPVHIISIESVRPAGECHYFKMGLRSAFYPHPYKTEEEALHKALFEPHGTGLQRLFENHFLYPCSRT
jgi:hypothetical protein